MPAIIDEHDGLAGLSLDTKTKLTAFAQMLASGQFDLLKDATWHSWVQTFATPLGPRNNPVYPTPQNPGINPIPLVYTRFRIWAIEIHGGVRFKCCDGLWKAWDGFIGGQW